MRSCALSTAARMYEPTHSLDDPEAARPVEQFGIESELSWTTNLQHRECQGRAPRAHAGGRQRDNRALNPGETRTDRSAQLELPNVVKRCALGDEQDRDHSAIRRLKHRPVPGGEVLSMRRK